MAIKEEKTQNKGTTMGPGGPLIVGLIAGLISPWWKVDVKFIDMKVPMSAAIGMLIGYLDYELVRNEYTDDYYLTPGFFGAHLGWRVFSVHNPNPDPKITEYYGTFTHNLKEYITTSNRHQAGDPSEYIKENIEIFKVSLKESMTTAADTAQKGSIGNPGSSSSINYLAIKKDDTASEALIKSFLSSGIADLIPDTNLLGYKHVVNTNMHVLFASLTSLATTLVSQKTIQLYNAIEDYFYHRFSTEEPVYEEAELSAEINQTVLLNNNHTIHLGSSDLPPVTIESIS